MDIYQVIKEPHTTEKATHQREFNQVSFKVHPKANKIEIKQAVETLFGAKVKEVKTLNVRGKRRRMGKNVGKKADWKKAVVKLAPGESIQIFEGT